MMSRGVSRLPTIFLEKNGQNTDTKHQNLEIGTTKGLKRPKINFPSPTTKLWKVRTKFGEKSQYTLILAILAILAPKYLILTIFGQKQVNLSMKKPKNLKFNNINQISSKILKNIFFSRKNAENPRFRHFKIFLSGFSLSKICLFLFFGKKLKKLKFLTTIKLKYLCIRT